MAEGSSMLAGPRFSETEDGLGADRFEALAEHLSDVIIRADMKGTLLYVSPACRAWGYEPQELVGRSATDLVHPDDLQRFNANTAQVFEDPTVDLGLDRAIRYLCKDGDWVWLEGNPQLVRYSDGRPKEIINALRDVTERRRLLLREAETARFEALAKTVAGVGYWRLEASSGLITWSDQMYAIYGLPSDKSPELAQAMGLLAPEDSAESHERLRLGLETGAGWNNAMTRVIRSDGEIRYVEGCGIAERDDNGVVVALFGTAVDITDLKRAELTALKAEERARAEGELFENAFRHAPIGMALVGLDGRFVKINRSFCDLVGLSESTMLGLDFQAITHADDLDADLGLLARLTAGEIPSYQMDKRYLRADGAVVWVCLSVSMVLDAAGGPKHYIAQVEDMTASRAAEQAVAESEAQYRLLADASSDIIVRYGPDGVIRYVSPACRALGVEPEQQVGLSVTNMIAADELTDAGAYLTKLFDGRESDPPAKHLNKIVDTAGRVVWLEDSPNRVRDASGKVVEIVSVLRDVTDRLKTEEALEQSERRFRLLAENAPDMICESRLDGTLTYVSPASLAITGFAAEELIGQNFLAVQHPDDGAKVLAMCQTVFESKGKVAPWPVEIRATHKDGSAIWLECQPKLALDSKTGRYTGLTDVIRDITARKALEADLRHARAEAEAAAAVKSEFLANMSHEIRTPLTAILGFAGLLSERDQMDNIGRGHLQRVLTASRSLLSIVNDVLDFSKLEAGRFEFAPQPIPLVETLHETLLMFAPQADVKALTLDFIAEGELPEHITIDPARLRQILFNLIGNAVKFTTEGAVRLRFTYDAASEMLVMAVEDSGPGISEADQGTLFQRFAQIDGSSTRQHGGTGLGLAICQGLAEAMGGRIGVTSELGRGSIFTVELPAPIAEAPPALEDEQAASSLDGVRVLVVDDNRVNRELAQAILGNAGAEVTLASDGESAADLVLSLPFDVILLDRRMPGMDGAATLRQIRAEPGPNDGIPVLAFTADTDRAQLLGPGGVDDLVSKPVNAQAMTEAILKWTNWDMPAKEPEVYDATIV